MQRVSGVLPYRRITNHMKRKPIVVVQWHEFFVVMSCGARGGGEILFTNACPGVRRPMTSSNSYKHGTEPCTRLSLAKLRFISLAPALTGGIILVAMRRPIGHGELDTPGRKNIAHSAGVTILQVFAMEFDICGCVSNATPPIKYTVVRVWCPWGIVGNVLLVQYAEECFCFRA